MVSPGVQSLSATADADSSCLFEKMFSVGHATFVLCSIDSKTKCLLEKKKIIILNSFKFNCELVWWHCTVSKNDCV